MTIKSQSEKPTPENVVKHTAGAFRADLRFVVKENGSKMGEYFCEVSSRHTKHLSQTDSYELAEQRASEIAATLNSAPELLEALTKLIHLIRVGVDAKVPHRHWEEHAYFKLAEAALSKAGGQR